MRIKLLATLLTFTLSMVIHAQQRGMSIDETQIRKLIYVQSAIKSMYVDTVNESKIVEDAIKGILSELDPHSTYIPKKDVEQTTEALNGSFEGIGVQYNMNEDTLVVIQPVSNGPSEKVGIVAGDKIVTVNDTAIAGVKMSKNDIMKRLRGPKGTKVNLGVIRQGVKGIQKFTVTRDKIPVHTVDAHYMIDERTGYVRVSTFGATTYEEFKGALEDMQKRGMRDLVIDLQGNGGGYLQASVEMCNLLLDKGDTIVYTDGRMVGRHDYVATGGKMDIDKIVVLVDGYTASAAEILSGAIQDNDRGIIVGRRTFAKGLVQRPFDLPDGSVLRLTVAHFYSPVGRCFQKPFVKGDKKKYEQDMMDRLNSGELMSADSIHFPDSLKYLTKGGRTVYGGGGIMPDVYVPLDTTQYTRLHREMSAKSVIIGTTLKYLDRNRKKLRKAYPTFEAFKEEYEPGDDIVNLLLEKTKDAKIEYTDSLLNASMPMVKMQLKALLARDLWDMNEYFQIINPTFEIYMAGLKALKQE